jgi:predicted MFS family arabinose efflux permease
MASATNEATLAIEKTKFPMAGLLALFTAGFLGIINETIPAGLLPEISESL